MPNTALLAPESIDDLLLYRLTRLLAVATEPLMRLCEGRHGITKREWRLIAVLGRSGRLLSSELAREVQLERSRTSKALTVLAAKGLVSRRPRSNDRRRVDIELTDTGRAIYAQILPFVRRLNLEILAPLTEAEVTALDSMLTRLQASAAQAVDRVQLPRVDRSRRHPVRAVE